MFKKVIAGIICVTLCCVLCLPVSAVTTAEDISQKCSISGAGYDGFAFLTDGKTYEFRESRDSAVINIKSPEKIGSIYIIFGRSHSEYTITDNDSGKKIIAGKDGFLHEYIDISALLGSSTESISISFKNGGVKIGEIYVFSSGDTPDFVQKWKASGTDRTDLMLFSAHGDDDQLFFAGLIPHYAIYKGYNIQVVYMTDHHNTPDPRQNEMLDGLWITGVTSYPVFGEFDDFRIDDIDKMYAEYEKRGFSKDELLGFVVEQIRRFKAPIVVGHDFGGEYGHGMHKVYADLLSKAVYSAKDKNEFSQTAEKYGIHNVQKAYFHNYEKNPIVLNFDTPLECLGGLTAFQYTQQKGFPSHTSQLKYDFTEWIYGTQGQITKASQLIKYNPAEYGLFYTTVGEDTSKDDMFENVVFAQTEPTVEPKPSPQEQEPTAQPPQDTNNNSVLFFVIISVAFLLLATVIFIGLRGRKKRK